MYDSLSNSNNKNKLINSGNINNNSSSNPIIRWSNHLLVVAKLVIVGQGVPVSKMANTIAVIMIKAMTMMATKTAITTWTFTTTTTTTTTKTVVPLESVVRFAILGMDVWDNPVAMSFDGMYDQVQETWMD